MFEIKLPSDMFDNVKNHIASTLFVARLKGNDGESFILVFEPAAQQSVQPTIATAALEDSPFETGIRRNAVIQSNRNSG